MLSDLTLQFATILGADKNSVLGAVSVAIAGAFVAFVVSFIVAVGEKISHWIKAYIAWRAAYVRFFTFVKIRQSNCMRIFTDANKAATQAKLAAGMRMYIVSGPPTDDYEVIAKYEKYMSYELQLYVRLLTEYDKMLFAQYAKIGTDEFKELDVTRKKAAIDNLYDAANDVIKISDKVLREFRKLARLQRLEPTVDRRLEETES